MTDSEKLIKLAEWFDLKSPGEGDEVQQDLRRIAAQLSSKSQECETLRQERRTYEKQYHGLVDENASIRAENERLGKIILEEPFQTIEKLRKRCEDLEAIIKDFESRPLNLSQ